MKIEIRSPIQIHRSRKPRLMATIRRAEEELRPNALHRLRGALGESLSSGLRNLADSIEGGKK